jgi:hypothetical protein
MLSGIQARLLVRGGASVRARLAVALAGNSARPERTRGAAGEPDPLARAA